MLYSIMTMIFQLTRMTTEKIPLNNYHVGYVTNRAVKDRLLTDDFIRLSNSEKKSSLLTPTSNDLSEDTSDYGTSSGIGKRHKRMNMRN